MLVLPEAARPELYQLRTMLSCDNQIVVNFCGILGFDPWFACNHSGIALPGRCRRKKALTIFVIGSGARSASKQNVHLVVVLHQRRRSCRVMQVHAQKIFMDYVDGDCACYPYACFSAPGSSWAPPICKHLFQVSLVSMCMRVFVRLPATIGS